MSGQCLSSCCALSDGERNTNGMSCVSQYCSLYTEARSGGPSVFFVPLFFSKSSFGGGIPSTVLQL